MTLPIMLDNGRVELGSGPNIGLRASGSTDFSASFVYVM
jgi:hypothetical protein